MVRRSAQRSTYGWRTGLSTTRAAKGPPAGMIEALTAFFATVLAPWLSYLTGTFGLGFLVGGAIFAVPDLVAAMKRWDARRAERTRPAPERVVDLAIRELRDNLNRLLDLLSDTGNARANKEEIYRLMQSIENSKHPIWSSIYTRQLRNDLITKSPLAISDNVQLHFVLGAHAQRDRALGPIRDIAEKIDARLASYGAS